MVVHPAAQCRDQAQTTFDLGLKLATGQILTLRVLLGPTFPSAAPQISILNRGVNHAWLDASGRVVGHNSLYTWNAYSSDLGTVVAEVMKEFCTRPPTLGVKNNGAARQPLMGGGRPQSQTQRTQSKPAEPEKERISIPPVPSHFEEIDDIDEDRLNELINNDSEFKEYFNSLGRVSSFKEIAAEMKKGNVSLAEANLKIRDALEGYKAELLSMDGTLKDLKNEHESKIRRQKVCLQKYRVDRLLAEMKTLVGESETKSEDIADQFTSGEINLGEFSRSFMRERELYHVRRLKAQLCERNVRGGTQGGGAPPYA